MSNYGSSPNSDHIVHRLGREIVGGVYLPDTRLPNEAEMLDRYQVSRTALREAYSKLTAKGMILARPKVGTRVRAASAWNMLDPDVLTWHMQTKPAYEVARDLYTLRRIIEPNAAALAAEFRNEEQLAEIASAYEDMKAKSKNEQQLVEADLRFHVAVLNATQNPFIGAFTSLIHAAMLSSFQLGWRGAEAAVIKEERLLQHGKVLDAVRDQDAELASTRMGELLDESIHDVEEASN